MESRIQKFAQYRDEIRDNYTLISENQKRAHSFVKGIKELKHFPEIYALTKPTLTFKTHYTIYLDKVDQVHEKLKTFHQTIYDDKLFDFNLEVQSLLQQDDQQLAQGMKQNYLNNQIYDEPARMQLTGATQLFNQLGELLHNYQRTLPQDLKILDQTLIKAKKGMKSDEHNELSKITRLTKSSHHAKFFPIFK